MEAVGESEKCAALLPVIYSKELYAQRRSSSKTGDIVALSSVNFYEGVTRDEVEKYYAGIMDKNDPEPISYGLNTKVVKGPDGKSVKRPGKSAESMDRHSRKSVRNSKKPRP